MRRNGNREGRTVTDRRAFDADVIISGAGPSGLVAGCEAALAGARVTILEKRDGPTWSRAGTIAPRVMELFAMRGIAAPLLARALEITAEPRSTSGIWAGMGPLHYEVLDTEYPWLLMFPQLETEKLLAHQFVALGGDLRRKSEVQGFTQDAGGVEVSYRDEAGTLRTLRGRYLVGADGNRSAVREAAGIDRHGTPARRIAVNVDAFVANPFPRPLTVFHNLNGWAMSYPLRDGLTRFAFIDAETNATPREGPPTEAEALAALRRVHGTDYGITRIDAINSFHDALLIADRIRDRRVFLVGESVRIHYPASGVGMQFCIQDAFNLGWKLGAVAAGHAAEALLDSYEAERLPEVEALLDNVRRQCAIQFSFDEEHLALKTFIETTVIPNPAINRHLAEELAGLATRYPAPEGGHPSIGQRMPNLALAGGGTLFERMRSGHFALLGLGGAALPPAAAGLRLDVVQAAAPDPGLASGAEILLIRPDGYVAWAGAAADTAGRDAAIRHWLNLDPAPLAADGGR